MKLLITLLMTSAVCASVNTLKESRYDFTTHQDRVISNSTNKKKVLIFLSPTCPCSQKQFDYLNLLSKKFSGIEFIGFSSNKFLEQAESEKHFNEYKIQFPIFADKDLKYANMFDALKTPHVFLLNEKNEIIYQGAVTNKRDPKESSKFYLNDILTAVKNNKELPYKTSKALGCYIAR